VCLGGLVLRVAYVVLFRGDDLPLNGDAFYYGAAADLITRGEGFVEPISYLMGAPQQTASHPPLYVLWLAIAAAVDPGSTTSQFVFLLWSVVPGVATIALCGLIGRRIAGPRCGLLAAIGAAVYPNIWLHDGMLLSETLAIFAVSLALWAAYRFWDRPTSGRVAFLGFTCAFASLVRPELMLMVPLLLFPLVLLAADVAVRRKVGWLALGCVVAIVTVSPWIGYNASRFDEPVYMSSNAGGTMAAANCDSTYYGTRIGYKDYACAREVWTEARDNNPGWDNFDQSEQDPLVQREARRYIEDHLQRALVVVAARVARILKLYGVRQEVQYDNLVHNQEIGVVYGGLVTWYVVAALAVAGAIVMRRRPVPLFPLLVVPTIVLLAVAITFAQTRYRAPAEPALVVLAAVAADALVARRKGEHADEVVEPAPPPAEVAVPV
jgi:4-amino-4-deoxy-L-arabinose transferase-like glycosyltransferase